MHDDRTFTLLIELLRFMAEVVILVIAFLLGRFSKR